MQYAEGERHMEMLLMGASLSIFGLAVACLAFGAATRGLEETKAAPPVELKVEKPAAAARFFAEPAMPVLPLVARPRVPIEALLLQIEDHVRLEHAAAESYLASPNAALLHSRTVSRLVN
jgi:hypothetical protein